MPGSLTLFYTIELENGNIYYTPLSERKGTQLVT